MTPFTLLDASNPQLVIFRMDLGRWTLAIKNKKVEMFPKSWWIIFKTIYRIATNNTLNFGSQHVHFCWRGSRFAQSAKNDRSLLKPAPPSTILRCKSAAHEVWLLLKVIYMNAWRSMNSFSTLIRNRFHGHVRKSRRRSAICVRLFNSSGQGHMNSTWTNNNCCKECAQKTFGSGAS